MYHRKARQLKNGLWHYTNASNHDIFPIGCCSLFKTCNECKGHGFINETECTCKYGAVKHESPCPGHKTEEEAIEHYRQYLLDKAHIVTFERSCPCRACGEETGTAMCCDESIYALCTEHCNRDGLDSILIVGESWGS